jgi:hypothetical protein
MLGLSDMSHDEFLRWAREAGFVELAELLLWRWDPSDRAGKFPDSAGAYSGKAETMLYGLRAGDDRDGFVQRVRANRGPGDDPASMDDDTLRSLHASIQRWLALSLPRWREQSELATLRALPFHCHVIKYDQARAQAGYDDGSWTSISDIGNVFNGELLTREHYERVEAAHVDTVLAMCRESGIFELEPMPWRSDQQTHQAIRVDAFAPQLRGLLREQDDRAVWRDPQLRFYVVVGYDYHVYAGSHVDCPGAIELAQRQGLRLEVNGPSPWLSPD